MSDPPLRQSTADLTIDACLKQLAKPRSKPTSDQPVSAPSATVTVEVGSEGGDRPALHDTAKAKPKPPLDTSPAADQPEVPKSPSKAKCAAPVEDVARHGAEDEVPDDPDSEDEPPDDDLSDDGWLETLRARSKLSTRRSLTRRRWAVQASHAGPCGTAPCSPADRGGDRKEPGPDLVPRAVSADLRLLRRSPAAVAVAAVPEVPGFRPVFAHRHRVSPVRGSRIRDRPGKRRLRRGRVAPVPVCAARPWHGPATAEGLFASPSIALTRLVRLKGR